MACTALYTPLAFSANALTKGLFCAILLSSEMERTWKKLANISHCLPSTFWRMGRFYQGVSKMQSNGWYFRCARGNELVFENGVFHGYMYQAEGGVEINVSRPLFSIAALSEFLSKMGIKPANTFVELARKLKFPLEKTARDLVYDDMFEIMPLHRPAVNHLRSALSRKECMDFLRTPDLSEMEQLSSSLFGGNPMALA